MRLIGALSKQGIQNRLKRLNAQRERILRDSESQPRPRKAVKLRCGAIQQAVTAVLREADEPLAAQEIHAAVESRLDQPVSRDSVHWCLSTGAKGESGRYERVSTGWYRLRPSTS